MRLTLFQAVIATVASAVMIFLLRALPFILFSKRKPPKIISFIEKYIPAMVIGVLIIYCLVDPKYISFSEAPYGIPALVAVVSAVLLHLWKGNSMLSIFGSTIIFMILERVI